MMKRQKGDQQIQCVISRERLPLSKSDVQLWRVSVMDKSQISNALHNYV